MHRERRPKALVFTDASGVAISDHHIAERFREHLELAGVNRPELFERSRARMPIRVHDLRATFVTLALRITAPRRGCRTALATVPAT